MLFCPRAWTECAGTALGLLGCVMRLIISTSVRGGSSLSSSPCRLRPVLPLVLAWLESSDPPDPLPLSSCPELPPRLLLPLLSSSLSVSVDCVVGVVVVVEVRSEELSLSLLEDVDVEDVEVEDVDVLVDLRVLASAAAMNVVVDDADWQAASKTRGRIRPPAQNSASIRQSRHASRIGAFGLCLRFSGGDAAKPPVRRR